MGTNTVPATLAGLLSFPVSAELLGSIQAHSEEPELLQRCCSPVSFLKNDVTYFYCMYQSLYFHLKVFGLVIQLAFRNVNHSGRMLCIAFHLLYNLNKRFVELLLFNSEVVVESIRILDMFWVCLFVCFPN